MEIDGDKVRRLRGERVLSQRELARESGISELTLMKIELGERPRPHPATIRGIARALGIDPRDILKKQGAECSTSN